MTKQEFDQVIDECFQTVDRVVDAALDRMEAEQAMEPEAERERRLR